MQRFLAANPLEFAIFNDPQQFLLHKRGAVGQFIQKQGAPVRPLESALMRPRCAGEGTGLVAEQLVFQK